MELCCPLEDSASQSSYPVQQSGEKAQLYLAVHQGQPGRGV